MQKEFPPQYNPADVEEKIYRMWEESGFFNPDRLPTRHKKPFTIIMPPPNANGALHIGHALFVTLQDIMIRFARMRGRKTLWLPGADHAGFETQVVFDKKLEKEGRNRFAIPRDELYAEMLEFTKENKKTMEHQLRKLGASCDWSREKFTLDPDIIKLTQDTFIQMYKDGLVYRGERIVNWCVKHQTTLSDLEIRYEERIDPLYYMKYGPLTLATVRPETKFGDTAVAVNPKDKRYKQYIGKELEIETLLGKVKIKVIADDAVDMQFGTGVVKVTPAHDATDFEMGTRHGLEVRQVIGRDGRLNEKTGPYAGLKVMEARSKIAEDLQTHGLMKKIDEQYMHNVSVCYKCGNTVEPLVIPQWFVKMKPLAEQAMQAVEKKKIMFLPDRFRKVYFHWLKNIRDWNISRQIAWGIRIPAWFKKMDGEIYVGVKPPIGEDWQQDPDVFDTWFSSGQWPYAALGWPKNKDFKTFYPTDVMETGWDILFFWVARMIMFGLYRTKNVPFKTVYLHGLVRDKDRQKMSKSKGNVIDPLGIAEQYGTDAVRMALIVGNLPGNDVVISEEKIRGYRNFANKVWNITRFILLHTENVNISKQPVLTATDAKHLKKLNALVEEITEHMENFKFYLAAEKLYHYVWHTFADKIIEESKPILNGENAKIKKSRQWLLLEILATCLQLLHPFMPFITESLWDALSIPKKKLLMVESWPSSS